MKKLLCFWLLVLSSFITTSVAQDMTFPSEADFEVVERVFGQTSLQRLENMIHVTYNPEVFLRRSNGDVVEYLLSSQQFECAQSAYELLDETLAIYELDVDVEFQITTYEACDGGSSIRSRRDDLQLIRIRKSRRSSLETPIVSDIDNSSRPAGCFNGVWVNTYTRQDGTQVRAHWRGCPGDPILVSTQPTAPVQRITPPPTPRSSRCGPGQTYVAPYTRSNGTRVSGYCRRR